MGCAPNSLAASASRRSSRPVIATRDPAPASAFAMESPIPLVPPVTSTVAPWRFIATEYRVASGVVDFAPSRGPVRAFVADRPADPARVAEDGVRGVEPGHEGAVE